MNNAEDTNEDVKPWYKKLRKPTKTELMIGLSGFAVGAGIVLVFAIRNDKVLKAANNLLEIQIGLLTAENVKKASEISSLKQSLRGATHLSSGKVKDLINTMSKV